MFRLFAIQDFSINLYIVSVSCKETEMKPYENIRLD